MPTALRRSKSLPVWLALIAALAVMVALATVVMTNVLSSRRTADTAAGETERARMQQAMLAQTPSADTADAQLSGNTASTPAVTPASSGGDDATDAIAAMATASTDSGDGPDTSADAQGMPNGPTVAASSASTMPTHRSRASASRMAAIRRKAAAARDGNSLRADIARYNAERGANLTSQRLVPLRTAVVPSGHSLWDDVPAPMSDVYRN